MKTIKLFFGSIFLITFSIYASAQVVPSTGVKNQVNTMLSTNNSIELRGSSDIRKIEIELNEEMSYFSLDVKGQIKKGSTKIEIFDPRGKKRGSFSTGTIIEDKSFVSTKTEKNEKTSNYEEYVSGKIIQPNASSGTWIIKIIPKNAHGTLSFSSQYSSTK